MHPKKLQQFLLKYILSAQYKNPGELLLHETWLNLVNFNDTESPEWSVLLFFYREFLRKDHVDHFKMTTPTASFALGQNLTSIWAALVFLSTSLNLVIFLQPPNFKTFLSFTMKFQLSQFEAQTKHRTEKHTAQN